MTDPYLVVALPVELEGHAVEWEPWEQPPLMTHVPLDCDTCDWRDGPRTAWGLVTIPPRKRSQGPTRLRRFFASRCPRCQETHVYRLGAERLGEPVMFGDPRFVEVLRLAPRTEAA